MAETQAEERHSIEVLRECIALQQRKALDYQSEESAIPQATHYMRGVSSILDMAYQKLIRMYSLLAKVEAGKDCEFESIEDSAKDAINYLSFFVSYSREKMDGQVPERDIFNRVRRAHFSAKATERATVD